MIKFQQNYDAVVIGARCAGAATALLLARSGAKVLLVDRQARGSDTMSTHALMRTGVLQLKRWGLLRRITAERTPQICETTLHYGPDAVRVAIKTEHDVDHLCAPRRTVLDSILVDAAEAAGVEVHHGVLLSGLQFDSSGRVVGAWLKHDDDRQSGIAAGLVVGADGRQSTVAKLVNAETYLEARFSSGCVYGYFEDLPDDGLHWYFEDQVAAGVIPTNHGQHCVFAGVPQHQFGATFRGDVERGFLRVIEQCSSHLRGEIEAAQRVGRLRGFAGARGFLRQPHGPGWALVGDAGYFKDPLTAHGITDALRDAELLARAVLDGRPRAMAGYQQARDVLSIPLFEVTDAIASFRWNLDEAKALHARLSASMKAEVSYMAELSEPCTEIA
jgi:flavin-dependent dehydrogenase